MRLEPLAALALVAACAGSPEPSVVPLTEDDLRPGPWTQLFDGRGLGALVPTSFGGEGEVHVEDGALVLPFGSPLTGVTYPGAFPTRDYELECAAARLSGSDFFCGLTFPVQDQHATLVLGGWGGTLTGLSCVDGEDASNNPTRRFVHFETGRDYRIRVRVGGGRLRCFLDEELIVNLALAAHDFSLRPEVQLTRPLGLSTFLTTGRISALRYRRLKPGPE
ncbi:MAG: DUF1080 domain-containing protein [Planctomycetota bacterium]|nr:DUF1080 domain-containing protein [Planctomycetota bacterium]